MPKPRNLYYLIDNYNSAYRNPFGYVATGKRMPIMQAERNSINVRVLQNKILLN